jgi:hypothetical protein
MAIRTPGELLDWAVDTTWVVLLAVAIAVVSLISLSYWPLTAGAIPLGVAAFRRSSVAFWLVAMLLGACALLVALLRSLF